MGRPATKAVRAPPQNEGPPAELLLGNWKALAPTEPAARPPSLGLRHLLRPPQRVRDPAQLPWASRSAASRCPSGGRSGICVPCGWQHSPSSEACSCQVRPSQHQPWLVSTCSVTAHPFHRFCYAPASTPRRATHTSQPPGRGRGSATTAAGPRTVGVGRDSLQLTRGGAQPTMGSFVVTDAAPAATGLAARLCPVVAALGGTSSTQTLASRAGTTVAFRSGRRG